MPGRLDHQGDPTHPSSSTGGENFQPLGYVARSQQRMETDKEIFREPPSPITPRMPKSGQTGRQFHFRFGSFGGSDHGQD